MKVPQMPGEGEAQPVAREEEGEEPNRLDLLGLQ